MVPDRARAVLRDGPLPARLPRARALPLHDRRRGHRAAAAAARARDRGPGQRRLPRDQARPDPVPAGGVRQARGRHLPGLLPGRHPRRAGPGALPEALAAALRAADRDLGRGDDPARVHPRPGLVADVLRRLPGAPLRGHRAPVLRGHRRGDVLRRRHVLRQHGQPRGRALRDLARPVRPPRGRGRGLPDRPVPLRAGRRRAVRPGVRARAVRAAHGAADPARRPHRPGLRPDRQRARAVRRGRRCWSPTCCSYRAG